MFEHLDDPNPFRPAAEQRATIIGEAGRRRHRRNRRIVGSATGLFAVGALVVAAFVMTEGHRLDRIHKVQVATQAATEPGVQTILVVGTDRDVIPGVTTVGADSIAAIRIDATHHRADVLPVPRDLAVTDPTSGESARATALFRAHGPSALVGAIQNTLGVSIQHYIQIDPHGFTALIDTVGGVGIRSELPLRDSRTGMHLAEGVCTRLRGDDALALARSRWVEVFQNGHWELDGSADLGRMQRESILGRAILASFRSTDVHNPIALDHLVDVFSEHVTVDSGLNRDALIQVARDARSLSADAVSVHWIPVEPEVLANGSAVLKAAPEWRDSVTAFEKGLSPASDTDGGVILNAPQATVTFESSPSFTVC